MNSELVPIYDKQMVVSRIKIEPNWLKKKYSDYDIYLYFAFRILFIAEDPEKWKEIKEFEKKEYQDLKKMYTEEMKDYFQINYNCLIQKPFNAILQKKSKKLGIILFREILINPQDIKIMEKMKRRINHLKKVELQDKKTFKTNSNQHVFQWNNKTKKNLDYRLLFEFHNDKKSNLAIYFEGKEEVEKSRVFFICKKEEDFLKIFFKKLQLRYKAKAAYELFQHGGIDRYSVIMKHLKEKKTEQKLKIISQKEEYKKRIQEKMEIIDDTMGKIIFHSIKELFQKWFETSKKLKIKNEEFDYKKTKNKNLLIEDLKEIVTHTKINSLRLFFSKIIEKVMKQNHRKNIPKNHPLFINKIISSGMIKPIVIIKNLSEIIIQVFESKFHKKSVDNHHVFWKLDKEIKDFDNEFIIEVYDEVSKEKEKSIFRAKILKKWSNFYKFWIFLFCPNKPLDIIRIKLKSGNCLQNTGWVLYDKIINLEVDPKKFKDYISILKENDMSVYKIVNIDSLIKKLKYKENVLNISLHLKNMILFKESYSKIAPEKIENLNQIELNELLKLNNSSKLYSGLPTYLRRKFWLLNERKQLFKIIIEKFQKSKKIKKKIVNIDERTIFELLLEETDDFEYYETNIFIYRDLKYLIEERYISKQFLKENSKIINNVLKTFFYVCTELFKASVNYFHNLLLILINIIQALTVSDDIFELENENNVLSEIFWIFISFFYFEIYLDNQSKIIELTGIKKKVIILRYLMQTNYKDFYNNLVKSNESIELLFGEQFLNIFSDFGFPSEFLFRIWDLLFQVCSIEKMNDKNKRKNNFEPIIISSQQNKSPVSQKQKSKIEELYAFKEEYHGKDIVISSFDIFIIAILMTVLKKEKNFSIPTKEFIRRCKLRTFFIIDFEEFADEVMKESDIIRKTLRNENFLLELQKEYFEYFKIFNELNKLLTEKDEGKIVNPGDTKNKFKESFSENIDYPYVVHVLIKNFDLTFSERMYLIEIDMEEDSKFFVFDFLEANYKINLKYPSKKYQEKGCICIKIYENPSDFNPDLIKKNPNLKLENLELLCESRVEFQIRKKEMLQRLITFCSRQTTCFKVKPPTAEVYLYLESYYNIAYSIISHLPESALLKDIFSYPRQENAVLVSKSLEVYQNFLSNKIGLNQASSNLFPLEQDLSLQINEMKNSMQISEEKKKKLSNLINLGKSKLTEDELKFLLECLESKKKFNMESFSHKFNLLAPKKIHSLTLLSYKMVGILGKKSEILDYIDNYVFSNELKPSCCLKSCVVTIGTFQFDLTPQFTEYMNNKNDIFGSKSLWISKDNKEILTEIMMKNILLKDFFSKNSATLSDYTKTFVLKYTKNYNLNMKFIANLNENLEIIDKNSLIKESIPVLNGYIPIENNQLYSSIDFDIYRNKIPFLDYLLGHQIENISKIKKHYLIIQIFYGELFIYELEIIIQFNIAGLGETKAYDFYCTKIKWEGIAEEINQKNRHTIDNVNFIPFQASGDLINLNLTMFTSFRVCISQIQNAVLKDLVLRYKSKEKNMVNFLKLIPNIANSSFLIEDPVINLIDKPDKISEEDYDCCLFQLIQKYDCLKFSFKYNEDERKNLQESQPLFKNKMKRKLKALSVFIYPDMSFEWLKCLVWQRENEFLVEFNNFGGIYLKNKEEVFILE